jgi:uncharacterized membrane protein
MKTVLGVFASLVEAERAARDLENIGIPNVDISIVAGNIAERHKEYLEKARLSSTSAGAAAASGASTGGGVGLIAGLIALAIPGVGPIVAGGAFATLLTGFAVGAAGGGLISAFTGMGVSHEEAPVYEEAVRRGAVMLAAHVNHPMEHDALDILSRHGARDIRDEVDTWKAAGWSAPDPHPYVYDDTLRSHEMPAEPASSDKPASPSPAD